MVKHRRYSDKPKEDSTQNDEKIEFQKQEISSEWDYLLEKFFPKMDSNPKSLNLILIELEFFNYLNKVFRLPFKVIKKLNPKKVFWLTFTLFSIIFKF